MGEKAIVLLVIILIMVLVLYLFHDTALVKSVLNFKVSRFQKNEVEIVNGPIVYYRTKPEKSYQSMVMKGTRFCIGRGFYNHLIAKSKTVEERHAVIRKRYKKQKVSYELINLGKINPVRYLNHEEGKYCILGYKDKVELAARDTFEVGDMTLQIIIPNTDCPTDTVRVGDLHLKEEETSETAETQKYKKPEDDAFDIPEFDF